MKMNKANRSVSKTFEVVEQSRGMLMAHFKIIKQLHPAARIMIHPRANGVLIGKVNLI